MTAAYPPRARSDGRGLEARRLSTQQGTHDVSPRVRTGDEQVAGERLGDRAPVGVAGEGEEPVALVVVVGAATLRRSRPSAHAARPTRARTGIAIRARAAPGEVDVLVVEEQLFVEQADVGQVARGEQHRPAGPREHGLGCLVLPVIPLEVAAVGAVPVAGEHGPHVVDHVERAAVERDGVPRARARPRARPRRGQARGPRHAVGGQSELARPRRIRLLHRARTMARPEVHWYPDSARGRARAPRTFDELGVTPQVRPGGAGAATRTPSRRRRRLDPGGGCRTAARSRGATRTGSSGAAPTFGL